MGRIWENSAVSLFGDQTTPFPFVNTRRAFKLVDCLYFGRQRANVYNEL